MAIRKAWNLRVWSVIISVALSIALVLTFLPMQVSIDTDGLLSISLSPSQAQEPAQFPIRPGFGWAPRDFSTYAGGFTAGQIYNVTCPSNINSGSGVSFSFANYTLTYHLSGGKMQWTSPDGAKTKSIGAILSSVGAIQPDGENNKVAYANAFLNTTVEYRAYSVGVKEVFILSELPYNDGKIADSYLEYTGELTWDSGLSVWVDGIEYPDKTFTTSSSVDFRDTATNETVFSFLAPIAWDSSNLTCSAVYDVKVSADKVQYGLRVPYSWLQTAVFPVTIDPSFTARTETYFDAASLTTPFDASVDKATGTAEGDILFALICWYTAGVTIDSVPSGWALATDGVTTAEYLANTDKYALYYKVAGASEPSTYTWSFSATTKVRIVCSCYTGGDFNASDPIDVVSNTANRVTTTIVRAENMTVSVVDSPLVFFGSLYYTAAARTYTKPSDIGADAWVEDDDAGSADSDFYCEVCSMVWSGSGATGDMDATLSGATLVATRHAFAVALNPAAACSANISNTPSSWSVNGGIPVNTSSSYSTGLSYFNVTNNSGGAIDIAISGANMTGGGSTWVLNDTATPGSMMYGLKASTGTETLYENYTTGADGSISIYDNYWGCQTFNSSTSHTITSVQLNLYRYGSPGTILVSIRATSGGQPTGSDLCLASTNGDVLTTDTGGEWRTITFTESCTLSSSIQYAIVARAVSGNVSNSLEWLNDASSPTYSGGSQVRSTNSGSSWTTYSGADSLFKDYGGVFNITVKLNAPYNNLVSSMADNTTQSWGLQIWAPTSYDDGNIKSGNVTLTATCV